MKRHHCDYCDKNLSTDKDCVEGILRRRDGEMSPNIVEATIILPEMEGDVCRACLINRLRKFADSLEYT